MRIKFLTVAVVALMLLPSPSQKVRSSMHEFDLKITNGRVVDGTGNPWFGADIAIKDGRIAEIGRIASDAATRTIDVEGRVVAPGFIDVHTHIEGGIEAHATADNFLHMRVTSVITGNCGGSALPLGEWFSRLETGGISIYRVARRA